MAKYALVFKANGGFCAAEDNDLGTFDSAYEALNYGGRLAQAMRAVEEMDWTDEALAAEMEHMAEIDARVETQFDAYLRTYEARCQEPY